MSRCRWTRGPCNERHPEATYSRAELEDLARMCNVSVHRRDRSLKPSSELCSDLTLAIDAVALGVPELRQVIDLTADDDDEVEVIPREAKQREAKERHDAPDPLADANARLADVRRDMAQLMASVRGEHTAEQQARRRALTATMLELMALQQQNAVERARQQALADEAAMQAQLDAGTPVCQGQDLETGDELKVGDPDVIAIVVDPRLPLQPQCYKQRQLIRALRKATPLFEWSRHSRDGAPGQPFRQSVYKLPYDNTFITGASFRTLYESHEDAFETVSIGRRIVGADNNYASSLFDRTVEVFHVFPKGQRSNPVYQFRENEGYTFVTHNVGGRWLDRSWKYAQSVSREQQLQIVLGSEALNQFVQTQLDPYQLYRVDAKFGPNEIQALPVAMVDVTTDPDLLLAYKTATLRRMQVYARWAYRVQPTDVTRIRQSIDSARDAMHVMGDELLASQNSLLYTWEANFIRRYFYNRNYLTALVYCMFLSNQSLGRARADALVSERMDAIVAPRLNLDELFQPFTDFDL